MLGHQWRVFASSLAGQKRNHQKIHLCLVEDVRMLTDTSWMTVDSMSHFYSNWPDSLAHLSFFSAVCHVDIFSLSIALALVVCPDFKELWPQIPTVIINDTTCFSFKISSKRGGHKLSRLIEKLRAIKYLSANLKCFLSKWGTEVQSAGNVAAVMFSFVLITQSCGVGSETMQSYN